MKKSFFVTMVMCSMLMLMFTLALAGHPSGSKPALGTATAPPIQQPLVCTKWSWIKPPTPTPTPTITGRLILCTEYHTK